MYPTPFQRKKGIKSLVKMASEVPEWIQKEADYERYTQEDLEKALTNELIFSWFKGILGILIGILSGILIIRTKLLGHILAIICLAFFIIIPRLCSFIRYGLFSSIRILRIPLTKKSYSIFFGVIHNDIVFVISIIIFIYLILHLTVKKSKSINSKSGSPSPLQN
jgi:hypothetical protein